MNKKLLGQALTVIGTPASYFSSMLLGCLPAGDVIGIAISAPLTILSLPLMPFAVKGRMIIDECLREEFVQRTKDLEHVMLPNKYAYIVPMETCGLCKVEPFYMDGEEEPFLSEEDARLFLKTLHYHEVLSKDTERLVTFWVKDDQVQS